MNRKRSNGFTLIELLITIALMLSLLAGAIVSFIKISDAKKEEAYRLVKEQILTAGEQYFSSNQYLFEGLAEGTEGKVSLGKLVESDFLNKVTNPINGEVISYCSYVEVKKENGQIKVKRFVENKSDSRNCDTNMFVTFLEPGGPEVPTLKKICKGAEITSDDWCNADVTIDINVKNNNNGDIVAILRDYNKEEYSSDVVAAERKGDHVERKDKITSEMKKTTIKYIAKNNMGKTSSAQIDVKIDKTPPTITINAYKRKIEDGKERKADNISVGSNINNSGNIINLLNSYSNNVNGWLNKQYYPEGVLYEISFSDNYELGEAEWKWNNTSLKSNSGNLNTVKSSSTLKFSNEREKSDVRSLSGDGYRKGWYTVTDKAGNSFTVNIVAPIDKTAPIIAINAYKRKNGGGKDNDVSIGNATTSKINNSVNLSSYSSTVNKWLNNEQYPYGIYYYASVSDNLELKQSVWKYNNGNLKSNDANIDTIKDQSVKNLNGYSYTQDFSLLSEGYRKGWYTVTDEAGNSSTISIVAPMDRTAPVNLTSEIRVNNSSGKKITNSDSWHRGVLWWGNFSANDSMSEIHHYEFSVDGETKKGNLSSNYTYGENKSNRNSIYYIRAIDKAGNPTAWSVPYYFKIDNESPTCTISKSGSIGDNNWYISNVSLSLNKSDKGGSGIAGYSLLDNNTANYTKKNTSGIQSEETKGITWYGFVKDVAGNTGNCSSGSFKLDKTPPTPYTIDITQSNAKNYLKGIKLLTASGGYDYVYEAYKCDEGPLVYSSVCEDTVSGVNASTKYLKWRLVKGSYSNNSSYKRFTNYIKSGSTWRQRTSEEGANPWMSMSDYYTQTGYDPATGTDATYYLNFKNLSGVNNNDYVIQYSKMCKDKAGNFSKKTWIKLHKSTGCN